MSGKKRGRQAIQVTSNELQIELEKLERSQPEGKFPNRSALWQAIEATEWAKSRSPRPLMGQVAMMIAKKHNLTILTPLGQKGRVKGCGPVVGGGRKKKVADPVLVQAQKKVTPKEYHELVDKANSGSLKACIKLKCLDCSNWQRKEVALCTVTDCSLYPVRPYKRVSLNMVEASNDEGTNAD